MRVLYWLDKHLWITPFLTLSGLSAGAVALRQEGSSAVALATVDPLTRHDLYGSLAGSSSALLGFALAAVAILAAFGPRETQSAATAAHERKMAKARLDLVKCLLSSSVTLAALLVCSTLGLAVDSRRRGIVALGDATASLATASLIGLLVGCAGLALAVAERASP